MSSDILNMVPYGSREPLDIALSRRSILRWGSLAGATLLTGCGGGGGGTSTGSASSSAVTIPTTSPGYTEQATTPAPTPTPVQQNVKTEFGVNYYDLFHRFITYAAPFNPEDQLKGLADRNLKVVRFVACPQWARDWDLWNANRDRYLGALDRIFTAGDKYGMKLVPMLMSAPYGLSDLKGEKFSAWANPNSATRQAFDAFVPFMVDRFRSYNSILMWEMANEMNAFSNNPLGYAYYPPVDPVTNILRSTADNYSDIDISAVYARFGELVRKSDAVRPFESGSTLPNAAETRRGSGRSGLDNRDELKLALAKTLAGGSTVLSVHLYDDICRDRFDSAGSSFAEIATIVRQVADANNAKFFLGEFGVPKGTDAAADRVRFRQMLTEIKASKADYACAWAYDHIYSDWNMSGPDRSWMLDDIQAANA